METDEVTPEGWCRDDASHLDRKYTPATPVAFAHASSGCRIEVIPTLITAPGSDTTWHVRRVDTEVSVIADGIDDRETALDRAREAMASRT